MGDEMLALMSADDMQHDFIDRSGFLVPHLIGAAFLLVMIVVDAVATAGWAIPLRVRYLGWACAVAAMILLVYANVEQLHDDERASTVIASGDTYRYVVWSLAALAIAGWGCEITCGRGRGLLGVCCWANCRSWTQFSAFDFFTVILVPLTGLGVAAAVIIAVLMWLPLLMRLGVYLWRGDTAAEMQCSWFASGLMWPFRAVMRCMPCRRTVAEHVQLDYDSEVRWRAADVARPSNSASEGLLRGVCYSVALVFYVIAAAHDWQR